ncbi:DNA modification methylase [Salinibacter ruber]|uniref:site-specific DNA-methyltransferase n=1 Tax=Salinibacter ruber TaxID=146919 RepID=UPI00216AB086|nr:site-specific DNA-methyltransferase [Salinibacter ruber]MCS3755234.1 DNA modification methylase [Salinibacter ruber]
MSKSESQIDIFEEKSEDKVDKENKNGDKKEVSPKNKLNDLSSSEWLKRTKSFFFQEGLGADHPHAQIEREHPAPFSFQDVKWLIEFFTKEGELVLDPFSGVGSTVKACAASGREGVGVELVEKWHDLAKKRMEVEVDSERRESQKLFRDDCRKFLAETENDTFDFIVTSPPYWNILNKDPDHKAQERVDEGLATSYSEDERDLGNIKEYEEFVGEVVNVFVECGRVLKEDQYMAIIVSDFRHKSKFYCFHSDLIQKLDEKEVSEEHKIHMQGVKSLLQNHKSLKPYGYPYAYVENIHHQHVLIMRKSKL